MRLKFFHVALLLSATLAFIACQSADSKVAAVAQNPNQNQNKSEATPTVYSDGARRMTVQEAQDLIKKNQLFVVDVRNQNSYDAGHIPGSKLIPEGEIVARVNELPKNKTILTYCS